MMNLPLAVVSLNIINMHPVSIFGNQSMNNIIFTYM